MDDIQLEIAKGHPTHHQNHGKIRWLFFAITMIPSKPFTQIMIKLAL